MTGKRFCLSLHYNGANSKGTEIYKFQAKDSKIVATPFCIGNVPKDRSVDGMKKIVFNGYVYDFSVDYEATDDINEIHSYFMKKKALRNRIFRYV